MACSEVLLRASMGGKASKSGGNHLKAVEGTGPGALPGKMTPNQEPDPSSENNPELTHVRTAREGYESF